MQEARAETVQAIAISMLAERFCDGAFVLAEEKAESALKWLFLDSLNDIPPSVYDSYLSAFERNPATACALADQLYAIGRGQAPPFNQFLRPRRSGGHPTPKAPSN
jgi:hypothetical protein